MNHTMTRAVIGRFLTAFTLGDAMNVLRSDTSAKLDIFGAVLFAHAAR